MVGSGPHFPSAHTNSKIRNSKIMKASYKYVKFGIKSKCKPLQHATIHTCLSRRYCYEGKSVVIPTSKTPLLI